VRVLSNPAYPTVEATAPEVIDRLRILCSSPHHEFWSDDISLLDSKLFRPTLLGGHQKITDACLLALVVRKGGRLATFDRDIPWKAVVGASREHLILLGNPAA
jgi:predicted nucleic acid-binding protein